MFHNPLSFEGRIRRTEFLISLLIYILGVILLNFFIKEQSNIGGITIISLGFVPLHWFFWAQSTKRCHDVGVSGWYQIIPFYTIWMLLAGGNSEKNKYGDNPRN